MNSSQDVSEIKKNPLPIISNESQYEEESSWEILNSDSSDQGTKRYWFKQNYMAWQGHQLTTGEQLQVIYH